jgi:hypothetical protein
MWVLLVLSLIALAVHAVNIAVAIQDKNYGMVIYSSIVVLVLAIFATVSVTILVMA